MEKVLQMGVYNNSKENASSFSERLMRDNSIYDFAKDGQETHFMNAQHECTIEEMVKLLHLCTVPETELQGASGNS